MRVRLGAFFIFPRLTLSVREDFCGNYVGAPEFCMTNEYGSGIQPYYQHSKFWLIVHALKCSSESAIIGTCICAPDGGSIIRPSLDVIIMRFLECVVSVTLSMHYLFQGIFAEDVRKEWILTAQVQSTKWGA